MDDLDLSVLTDDQLVALARACVLEASHRRGAAGTAMEQMMLDAREKMQIARDATEAEIAAMRAAERERVANEAAATARRTQQRQTQDQAAAKMRAASERLAEDKARLRNVLMEAGIIVQKPPQGLTVTYAKTYNGVRVLINQGPRYSSEHLLDYNVETKQIRSSRSLVPHKPALAAWAVAFAAAYPLGTSISGSDYQW